MNTLRIASKINGFRRCGKAHPAAAVDHPPGTFSEKEVEALKAEPMLVVQEISSAPSASEDSGKPQAPTDPAERLAAIKAVVESLDPESADNFMKDGRPKTEVLSEVVGWTVTAAERDEVAPKKNT